MLTERKRRLIVYLLTLIITGFVALTIFVALDPLSSIDRKFSMKVQSHHSPERDRIMEAISWAGYLPHAAILVAACIIIFLLMKRKREALFVFLSGLSGLVSSILKFLVNRPRPQEPLVRVLGIEAEKSFPSGHTIFYTVFFGFIMLLMFRLTDLPKAVRAIVAGICLLLILVVPISRIYLGAHWFTDVLGGGLVGLICLYVLGYFYLKGSRDGKTS